MNVLVAQIDARRHYAVSRALFAADSLMRLETTLCARHPLVRLAGGSVEGLAALAGGAATATAAGASAAAAGEYMAPWIDTAQCTACDECTKLNPQIFVYNSEKKAIFKDPNGGPYQDIVKAAEKCTARVIHPGLPMDRSPKDIEKWIKRAEKYN